MLVRRVRFASGTLRMTCTEKEKKRLDKSATAQADSNGVTPEKLREAIERLAAEETPKSPEEKEQFFMTQVSLGETLAGQGQSF